MRKLVGKLTAMLNSISRKLTQADKEAWSNAPHLAITFIAFTLLLLIIPVLVPGIITLAYTCQSQNSLIQQSEEDAVDTGGDFAVVLKDEPMPLASGAAPGGWALLNLLFTIAGTIMAFAISIYVLVKKQRALSGENAKSGNFKPLQFLLAPFFAIAGIILFALTQDISTKMITADGLTIAHATIFICTVLSSIIVYRNEKYGDDDLLKDG